jgi:hypothetical protein
MINLRIDEWSDVTSKVNDDNNLKIEGVCYLPSSKKTLEELPFSSLKKWVSTTMLLFNSAPLGDSRIRASWHQQWNPIGGHIRWRWGRAVGRRMEHRRCVPRGDSVDPGVGGIRTVVAHPRLSCRCGTTHPRPHHRMEPRRQRDPVVTSFDDRTLEAAM